MNIPAPLTNVNFWNEVGEEFPKAVNMFWKWVDEYKKEVEWNELFGSDIKYYDVPHAMQHGVWIAFCYDQLDNYFEQSEYVPTFDFEEEVKQVFAELEPLIDDEA